MGRRLNVKQAVNLHNYHHLVLTDARTGEIKQEAWAYNLILNQGLAALVSMLGASSTSTKNFSALLGQTYIGTGTGVPSPERTEMFAYLDNKASSNYSASYDIVTGISEIVRVAAYTEVEHPETTITEIALGSTGAIRTHALIEDSEGNPISVFKGEMDILTIYSSVYCELSHNYTENLKFVNGSDGNFFMRFFTADSGVSWTFSNTWRLHVGRNSDAVSFADPSVKTSIYSYSIPRHSNTETEKLIFNTSAYRIEAFRRVPTTEANHADGVWEIGFSKGGAPIFRSLMPLAGVWTGKTITGEILGQGDGTATVFQTTWAPIIEDSETITVDGVAQVKDTDYTIDYTTGDVTFDTAPAADAPVEGSYSVEFIPKDEDHVLDIGFTIQFADANA